MKMSVKKKNESIEIKTAVHAFKLDTAGLPRMLPTKKMYKFVLDV